MLKKLEKFESRYKELEGLLSSFEILSDREASNKLAKELSQIKEHVVLFREYKKILKEAAELEAVLKEKHENDFVDLAKKELQELKAREVAMEEKLKALFVEKDKDADRDVILEIRQGTGGDEAGLFAADLYRMYSKYAASKGWSVETMSLASNE